MVLVKYLWLCGSLITGVLGAIHFVLTFFTNKFLPTDAKLAEVMDKTSPLLSSALSMWKAWIGFNGSHSGGLLFIALINGFIALKYFPVFHKSHFFFLLTIVVMGFYVFLARKYWYTIPLIGVSMAFTCFIISYALMTLQRD